MTPADEAILAAAKAAALAWSAARKQRQNPCVMAPWDESTYCLDPAVNLIFLPSGVSTQIAASNPQRVAIGVSQPLQAANAITVCPCKEIDSLAPSGFILFDTSGIVWFLQKDVLNLVQAAWYALAPAGNNTITVIEIVLRHWPKG